MTNWSLKELSITCSGSACTVLLIIFSPLLIFNCSQHGNHPTHQTSSKIDHSGENGKRTRDFCCRRRMPFAGRCERLETCNTSLFPQKMAHPCLRRAAGPWCLLRKWIFYHRAKDAEAGPVLGSTGWVRVLYGVMYGLCAWSAVLSSDGFTVGLDSPWGFGITFSPTPTAVVLLKQILKLKRNQNNENVSVGNTTPRVAGRVSTMVFQICSLGGFFLSPLLRQAPEEHWGLTSP